MEQFQSAYANVRYIQEDGIVLLVWKKFCCFDNFRQPAEYALELLIDHPGSSLLVDAQKGFEAEHEDREWVAAALLPALLRTDCPRVCILAGEKEQEATDRWIAQLPEHLEGKRAGDYQEGVGFLKRAQDDPEQGEQSIV